MTNEKLEVQQGHQGFIVGGELVMTPTQIIQTKRQLRQIKVSIPVKELELQLVKETETDMTLALAFNIKQNERLVEWKAEQVVLRAKAQKEKELKAEQTKAEHAKLAEKAKQAAELKINENKPPTQ